MNVCSYVARFLDVLMDLDSGFDSAPARSQCESGIWITDATEIQAGNSACFVFVEVGHANEGDQISLLLRCLQIEITREM